MDKERIQWLDGIKGLACLLIFLHHFMLTFFNASYYGEEAVSMTATGIDTLLAYKPYGVIINGNFWVCVFFVISGFLLSRQVFRLTSSENTDIPGKISSMLLKRYPRLMLPAFFILFLDYFMLALLSACRLNYTGRTNTLSFLSLLKHSLITMWLTIDIDLLGHLWMMHLLLFGSYLAILLALMAGKNRRYMLPVYLFLLYAFGSYNHYYTAFIFSVMLAYLLERTSLLQELKKKQPLCLCLGIFSLLFGLFLGGYPSYAPPIDLYHLLYQFTALFLNPETTSFDTLFHCIGAVLWITSFFLLPALADFFSAKPFLKLGEISFGVYLLHPLLLLYLGAPLKSMATRLIPGYTSGCLVILLILVLLLLPLAFLFHCTVEKWCDKLVRRLVRGKTC